MIIYQNSYPNSHSQWKPKPQLTHKKQMNFTISICIITKRPCESIPKFTNMQILSSMLQVCISNLHAQCKPKPQLTHKKQTNFTICIYLYSQASLWSQTKINKYAKFVNYIAILHTTKKKSSRIHLFPKIHKQTR